MDGKPKCEKCGKPLKAFGEKRANGKNHKDWETRKLHKKCWKEEQEAKETMRLYRALSGK